MLDMQTLQAQDLRDLNPQAWVAVAEQMLQHIAEQSKHIAEQGKRIDSQEKAIQWRDAKIESITFELARLKAWKFGAKTEAMNAEQRLLFEEAYAADEASLEAQLALLQQNSTILRPAPDLPVRRQPKREALPAHLPRVEQHIDPADKFFSVLSTLNDGMRGRILSHPEDLLRVTGRVRRVGISDTPQGGAVDLGFEVDDANGPKVILMQGRFEDVWRLQSALEGRYPTETPLLREEAP